MLGFMVDFPDNPVLFIDVYLLGYSDHNVDYITIFLRRKSYADYTALQKKFPRINFKHSVSFSPAEYEDSSQFMSRFSKLLRQMSRNQPNGLFAGCVYA